MKQLNELLEFGIINLDKPSNYTSFQAGEIVGKMLGLRKFSHAGTLDPQVTGVLPIMLNRACKLLGWFMKKNKTYVGVMRIHQKISKAKLEEEMNNFLGKIMQLPPVKSRVKREVREREVYSWKILEINGNNVLFEAEVEAGTYIRKLISDLGEKIGGAHMTELRRTKAGIFDEKDAITIYELEKIKDNPEELRKIIIPAEEAIKKILPCVQTKMEVKELLRGKPIHKQDLRQVPETDFAIFSGDKFIGIYKPVDEGEIVARAEFVFN